MNNLYYRLGQWPIGRSIEIVLMLVLAALLVTITGCASPQLQSAANPEPLTIHDANAARAMALQKIGESGDPETKRLAIFALVTMGNNQAAPAPVVMQGPRTIGDAVFGFLDRTLERALAVAPAYLAYKGQVRSAQTTETVAAISRDVSLNQSNNFLALGQAGIGGTQNVGIAGVNALATVAGRPTSVTTNTIAGGAGPVNLGGTLTYSPVTGSYNPITGSYNPITTNPARICTVGPTGVQTCSGP